VSTEDGISLDNPLYHTVDRRADAAVSVCLGVSLPPDDLPRPPREPHPLQTAT